MTYEEAQQKINSLLVFGSQPGLERISEFVKRLGSPDKDMKFVHIAGTNGKGSTCTMISSVLSSAGYKTGRFISPYVIEFRERIMIDGKMIPEQTLADIVEEIDPVREQMNKEGMVITEFEFIFAAALLWYKRENCDIVVLETGLGGRFDATNIISTPLVSVITSISLDHTKILGDTYAKIAFEKCGIIKPDGITAAYGDQKPDAMEVIRNIAEERNNLLLIADPSSAENVRSDINGSEFVFNGSSFRIPLLGEHQIKNAVTALTAIEALRKNGINISNDAVRKGLADVSFPARMEIVQRQPLIMLDGAHNPDGTAALGAALRKYFSGKRLVGLVGMLADKDVEGALAPVIPLFDEIITTAPDNPRKMSAAELKCLLTPFCNNIRYNDNIALAVKDAVSSTGNNDALIVFGSLYLVSAVRSILVV